MDKEGIKDLQGLPRNLDSRIYELEYCNVIVDMKKNSCIVLFERYSENILRDVEDDLFK